MTARIEGFLDHRAVAAIREEIVALESEAHRQNVLGTPYLAPPDSTWPTDHPRNARSRSTVDVLAYDQFGADSPLRQLYESDDLMQEIGRILGRWPLYRYADPLGALNVAVMRDGYELGWHFDMTDFVVSIAIQASDTGGELQTVPDLRSAGDERYADVAAVLSGRAEHRIETIPMVPGTMLVFEGRYALHRVTPIVGPVPRYVALLAYDTKPGTDSTPGLKRMRYGRTNPRRADATR